MIANNETIIKTNLFISIVCPKKDSQLGLYEIKTSETFEPGENSESGRNSELSY